jgi:hypothetical protein
MDKELQDLKKLSEEQLIHHHKETMILRKHVLNFVQEFGFDANQLVSHTFEHEIEKEYGRKVLKRMGKNNA